MYQNHVHSPGGTEATIYCTACGGPMRVATQHVRMVVACPYCHQAIDPKRFVSADGRSACSWRNRWIAGLLGVLLGPLGIHRIYLGFVGIGILQMVVSFITCGIGGLWGFIEGVLWLAGKPMHDVDGLPLSEYHPWASPGRASAISRQPSAIS